MRRLLIASTCLLVTGGLLLPGSSGRAERIDVGTGYELENVEVMDSTMRLADARRYMIAFNDALGVQCRDCHDLKNFASDAKELKLAARDMMKMEREINARWFADETVPRVTCWTCHQGQRHPPTAMEPAGGRTPDGEPGDDASDEPDSPPAEEEE